MDARPQRARAASRSESSLARRLADDGARRRVHDRCGARPGDRLLARDGSRRRSTASSCATTRPRRFTFASPQAEFPLVLCELPILPEHLLGSVAHNEMRRAPFNTNPVGNGPFRFVERRAGERWVFRRNDAFPAGARRAAAARRPRRERRRRADDEIRRPRERGSRRRRHRAEHGVARGARSVAARAGLSGPVHDGPRLQRPQAAVRRCARAARHLAVDRSQANRRCGARRLRNAPPPVRFRRRVRSRSRSSRFAIRRSPIRCSTPPAGDARRIGMSHTQWQAIRVRSSHRWQRRQRARAARSSRPRRTRNPRPHSAGGARHLPHPGARARTKQFDVLVSGFPGDVALGFLSSMFETRQSGGALDYAGFHSPHLDALFAATRSARTEAERVAAWADVQRLLAEQSPDCLDLPLARLAGALRAAAQRRDGSARRDGDAVADGRTRRRHESSFYRRRRIGERAAIAAGPLRSLAVIVGEPIWNRCFARELYFPAAKALLSREGGRCARDGTLLEFDPFKPHEHRCPVCGEVYRGELHDRFWIYWYQLWLAERAIHAAALFRLGVGDRFAGLATSILDGYIERYSTYPNVDNVLGPTRLFFSTYLESIWLLQICVATDLLDATPSGAHGARARPDRRAESRDHRRVRRGRVEPAGVERRRAAGGESPRSTMRAAPRTRCSARRASSRTSARDCSPTERWYEGENYHLFAHRGLWYGVTMAEARRVSNCQPRSSIDFSAGSLRRSRRRCPISPFRRAATRSTRFRCASGVSPSIASWGSRAATIRSWRRR